MDGDSPPVNTTSSTARNPRGHCSPATRSTRSVHPGPHCPSRTDRSTTPAGSGTDSQYFASNRASLGSSRSSHGQHVALSESICGVESTRVDRWLWAVRLTKTRTDAAAACRGGHVRVNDRPAKPATTVVSGDEVRARVNGVTKTVEVVRVIQKRVGAADAATCFIDRTPAPPPEAAVAVAHRDRGAGRPTKRDRRILDKFRSGPPM
jgi:ribosome-associated heat shock protein Hsp15